MIRQAAHLDSISLVCEKKEVTEPLCKNFLCLCFYFPSLSLTFSYISSVLIVRARNPELVWVRNDLGGCRRSVIGAACRRLLASHPPPFLFITWNCRFLFSSRMGGITGKSVWIYFFGTDSCNFATSVLEDVENSDFLGSCWYWGYVTCLTNDIYNFKERRNLMKFSFISKVCNKSDKVFMGEKEVLSSLLFSCS